MSKLFILTKEMVEQPSIVCPICGHYYSSNGMGPQNNNKLTWAIQTVLFLTSKKFKFGSKAHDIAYMVVSQGQTLVYKHGSYQKVCQTRKCCDDLFYDLNLAAANNSYPWMKAYYKKWAKVTYDFVRQDGESSFNHEH